jgi:hypothetical protein
VDVGGTIVGEGIIVSVGTGVEEAGGKVGVGLSAAGTHADDRIAMDNKVSRNIDFIGLSPIDHFRQDAPLCGISLRSTSSSMGFV